MAAEPTPAAIEEFAQAWQAAGVNPQAAYEKLVDKLLQGPRFGERWARHWLDTVRFAESGGRVEKMLRTELRPVKPAPKNAYLDSLRALNTPERPPPDQSPLSP